MKIYNIYGAIICAALSLSVACDHPRDDYDLPQSGTEEGDKSTIKINCGDSSHQFSNSDMIGVTVIEESKQSDMVVDTNLNLCTNACFIKSGSYFIPGGVESFYSYPEGEFSLIAYYPYNLTLDGSTIAINLPLDQSAGYSSHKLLYGVATDCSNDGLPVNVTLESKLSTLVVNITADGSTVTSLDGYTLNIIDFVMSTTLDLNDGSMDSTGVEAASEVIGYGADSDTFKFLVVPQTIPADQSFLELNVNGETTRCSRDEAIIFEEGKTTTISVTVSSDFVDITVEYSANDNIDDWDVDNDKITNS